MTGQADQEGTRALLHLVDHGWQVLMVPPLFGGASESVLSWVHDGLVDTLRFYLDGQNAVLARAPAQWSPTVPPTHSPPSHHEVLPTAEALARALQITLDHHEHESARRGADNTQAWPHHDLPSPTDTTGRDPPGHTWEGHPPR